MTNHQKLRQLPVKQLAKLLVKYCPYVNYCSCYYDDDYDCDDDISTGAEKRDWYQKSYWCFQRKNFM